MSAENGRPLLVRGRVWTNDPARPHAEAVLVRGAFIEAVGRLAELRAAAPDAEVLDAGQGAVLPGLVDGHGHLMLLGRALDSIGLGAARGMADVVAACRARAAVQPRGWLTGRGWDQSGWTTGDTLPDASALDAAFPDRPVFLARVDGHAALANAVALRLAGIGASTPDPPGGRIERRADGSPTGLLLDTAMAPVMAAVPPPDRAQLERWLLAASRHLLSLGITGLHDAGIGVATDEAYRHLARESALPLRVHAMADLSDPDGRALVAGGPHGEGLYSLGGAKLFADGALGSRGAQLFEDYDDDPGNRGLAVQDDGALRELAEPAARAGFQLAVHAIGDRANARVLDLYEWLSPRVSLFRPRVEHAQILRKEDFARFVRLGAVASMQPVHATSDRRYAARRLGERRLAGAYAWRSLREAGVPLAFGSDFPVEDADPRAGLHAATTRTGTDGEPRGGWRAEEALPPEAALEAFTAGCAYACGRERELGRLRPGFRADLTVLGTDPLRDGGWPAAPVLAAVVDGRVR